MTLPNTSTPQPLHPAKQMRLANPKFFPSEFFQKHFIKVVGFARRTNHTCIYNDYFFKPYFIFKFSSSEPTCTSLLHSLSIYTHQEIFPISPINSMQSTKLQVNESMRIFQNGWQCVPFGRICVVLVLMLVHP